MHVIQKNAAIVLMALLLSFSVVNLSNIPVSLQYAGVEDNFPPPSTGPPHWPSLSLITAYLMPDKPDGTEFEALSYRNSGMRLTL